ncbi:MAG: sigma-70 family RNA polymerase sigma factor [Planctomycetia bacterium]|nr:sigma-70 family RNA polymerase sigma factor [Planctomycetia bacterium]
METTSISLLDQLRAGGNDEAWRTFDSLYRTWLRGWLTQRLMQSADVEDVLQNVMTVLLRELPEFRHNGRSGAFRAWLRGIVVNRIREFARQSHGGGLAGDDGERVLGELADEQSLLSQQWDREHNEHLVSQLLGLAERDFGATTVQAFRATVLEGKTAAETAAALGISEASVWAAKSRVLSRLRREENLLK